MNTYRNTVKKNNENDKKEITFLNFKFQQKGT